MLVCLCNAIITLRFLSITREILILLSVGGQSSDISTSGTTDSDPSTYPCTPDLAAHIYLVSRVKILILPHLDPVLPSYLSHISIYCGFLSICLSTAGSMFNPCHAVTWPFPLCEDRVFCQRRPVRQEMTRLCSQSFYSMYSWGTAEHLS